MKRLQVNKSGFPNGPISLVYRVYKYVLPEVNAQLQEWRVKAEEIPDPELRKQAIDSMTSKQFHCQGGAVYAVANLAERHVLIPLIVAFQTISDYLDNLCDRSTSQSEQDFRLLHQSMLDAINPKASVKNYYAKREETEDGGYLQQLVRTCQSCILLLPSFGVVYPYIKQLVSLYCDLQVYKHLSKDIRESKLRSWWEDHHHLAPKLKWNEFAAATGSTLGVFMLFQAASKAELKVEEALNIRNRYFPDICALHILLDYFIDQEEDRIGGDLNFCHYYESPEMVVHRLETVVEYALKASQLLEQPKFHRMVVEGLLALYLSDPKVKQQQNVDNITRKIMRKSPLMRFFFKVNSIWIRKKHTSY